MAIFSLSCIGAFNAQAAVVEYTLFFIDALTPTSGSLIDLVRSKWEYGRGFNTTPLSGKFVSGSIVLVLTIGSDGYGVGDLCTAIGC